MAIKFIEQLRPNGKTFCIADANDIKGGLHYAANLVELHKIHNSRLVHGTLCYVQSKNKNYTYVINDNVGEWVEANDGVYSCTTSGISNNTKMSGSLGNLKDLTRNDLEGMSINDILTRALFNEEFPTISYTNPTLTLNSCEVGTQLGTTTNASIKSITTGSFSYSYSKDTLSPVSYKYVYNLITLGVNTPYTVKFGENKDVYKVTWILSGVDNTTLLQLCDLKGNTINDGELAVTSWGRTVNDYNTDNKTSKSLTMPKDAYINESVYYSVDGYFKVRYFAGNSIEDAVKISDDYSSANSLFNNNSKINVFSDNITKNITGNNTITLTTSVTTNSAFVYVFVPAGFKIKEAKMQNGLNKTYEDTPFGLIADELNTDSETQSFNGYTCNIYYIAKGDPNNDGYVSPASEPIQITIIKES